MGVRGVIPAPRAGADVKPNAYVAGAGESTRCIPTPISRTGPSGK